VELLQVAGCAISGRLVVGVQFHRAIAAALSVALPFLAGFN